MQLDVQPFHHSGRVGVNLATPMAKIAVLTDQTI